MDKKPEISALQAKQELWRRGQLQWKLGPHQKELYDLFHGTDHKIQTWLLSRRYGKTYTLCIFALEMCLRKPGSIVKFVSPTRLQVQNNIRPIIRQITEDCPDDLKPDFKTQDFIYYFPNGSELQLAGSESGHAEKLRGGSAHIAIIDEAQDVTDLNNIIMSILLPTTLTTGGKVLLAGTPPRSTDHDFVTRIEDAEARGSLIKKTIFQNIRLSKEQIQETIDQYPLGEKSEEFRREYLCEIIKDQNISVVPEFTEELEKEIVKEWTRPPFFDGYVAMDLGGVDLTGLVFGYYDFKNNKIIIEDEIVMDFSLKDMNITTLTDKIKAKEESLWLNPLSQEVKKPYMRVSDINPIVTQEIAVKSRNEIFFMPTKKDDKEAAINNMRMLLGSKKIIIHPRCVNLLRHLRNVKWASVKNKNTFGRSPDNGHYDLVDALIYMCRSVLFNKNPYPVGYEFNSKDVFIANPENYYGRARSTNLAAYRKIFGVKK